MRLSKDKAREAPIICRFNLAGHEEENGDMMVDVGEFLSLMRHEYKIITSALYDLRTTHAKAHTKNIDRVDGITQALTLMLERKAVVEALYQALGSPVYDPLEQSTSVTATKLAECSHGDFTGTSKEVVQHCDMMRVLEDVHEHHVLVEIEKENDK